MGDSTELKEALASSMKDKSERGALAELMVEYIQPSHITTDFVSMLLNTRRLNKGDALIKKVRKGIEVYTFVPGAKPLRNEVTVTDRINFILDGSIVGVQASEWDLESGDIGTIESLRAEALAKLKDHYQNKVFTALSTIWTAGNTPDNYTNLGTAITSTALEDAIERINETTSGAKAIVGLRSDLTPITKFGSFWGEDSSGITSRWAGIDSQLSEVMQTGWLGKFYGVPIIALNQTYNNADDYTAQLPTGRIMVIGENVGEFITYGEARPKEFTDMEPTPPVWKFDMYQEYGFIIDNAQGIYCLGVA